MSAIVFDWETTGLPLHPSAPLAQQPRGIEFGAVLIGRDGKIEEEISILINPGHALDPVITKITGLTDADLADAPPIAVVMPQIARAFSCARLAIAHNLAFDKSILHFELARLGITDFPWPHQELCTVEAHSSWWGRRPKLKELYLQVMERELPQTHRALDDAKALSEIVVRLGLHLEPKSESDDDDACQTPTTDRT